MQEAGQRGLKDKAGLLPPQPQSGGHGSSSPSAMVYCHRLLYPLLWKNGRGKPLVALFCSAYTSLLYTNVDKPKRSLDARKIQ
jgi:hypothetical protein